MADITALAEKIIRWEGGFVDDPIDRGGATNLGVTIATWKQVGYDKDGDGDIDSEDVRCLTLEDGLNVLHHYWDRWQADLIRSQPLANMLVDWVWTSGKWGIVIPQRLLKVSDDGIVGPVTITALNHQNPKVFLRQVFTARFSFLINLVKSDPSQLKFFRGWVNRLNDFI